MSIRTVLITGTTSGIGLATAVAAARAGWHVVATTRDTGKSGLLEAAARDAVVSVDVRALDVTDPASVDACLAGLDPLHALVNDAGAGHVGTWSGRASRTYGPSGSPSTRPTVRPSSRSRASWSLWPRLRTPLAYP
ncbi:SDR family NAD(P)-dependent oxidoreductase [Streptomyces sp. NPDC058867]|uniref:SDR family NAD(P)-dependent oxidoreductase n=1 Tax=unclassified Streptomyces TaxID=2593676 RepID=UPI0036CEF7CE